MIMIVNVSRFIFIIFINIKCRWHHILCADDDVGRFSCMTDATTQTLVEGWTGDA